ncbi:pentapeptide repeat-containing protein [Streptomyces nogalater]
MGAARFDEASFSGDANFREVTFSGDARFDWASFSGDARFVGASFSRDAVFDGVWFETVPHLGPLVCRQREVLDGAVFQQPVTLEIAADQVSCARTRWASTAMLRLRYAELDLRDAVFEYPVVVAAQSTPFRSRNAADSLVSETELSGEEPGVRLVSVGGADVLHLGRFFQIIGSLVWVCR